MIEASSSEAQNCRPDEAINFTRTLFGMYRKADFNDPVVFATALSSVFATYPANLCRLVIDPLEGLPSKLKFPPSIAEVKEALDKAVSTQKIIGPLAERFMAARRDAIKSAKNSAICISNFEISDRYRRCAGDLLFAANPSVYGEIEGLDQLDAEIATKRAERDKEHQKWLAENPGVQPYLSPWIGGR